MSVRTLGGWRSLDGARAPGRPPHARCEWLRVLRVVGRDRRELPRQAGWRVHSAEHPELPVRLVQCATRAWKAHERCRRREVLERARTRVRVHVRDAVWAQDATQVGRANGECVVAEVLKDPASGRTLGVALGRPATGEDVVRTLEAARRERGGLPLVWMTDNGPAYRSAEVARYLAAGRVVHLRSEPRTPQHNAVCERGIGELKYEAGLRSDTCVSLGEAVLRMREARWKLDERLPRASKGGRTAAETDRELEPWYHRVRRQDFHEAARHNVRHAVQGRKNARARRRAVREAVWATLQQFKLVTRTRGGMPVPAAEAEGIS